MLIPREYGFFFLIYGPNVILKAFFVNFVKWCEIWIFKYIYYDILIELQDSRWLILKFF